MILQYISPPAALKHHIRDYLLLQKKPGSPKAETFHFFADGCPGLIFQEHTTAVIDGDRQALPQLFLHGLTTKSLKKTTSGPYCNIVVRLQPHGLKSIFGINANQLTNSYVNFDDCLKSSLYQDLLGAGSLHSRFAILSAFFAEQIAKNNYSELKKVDLIISRVTNSTVNNNSISTIAKSLQLTERSLERIMKTNIGVGPKTYFRINRFQTALNHLRNSSNIPLTKLAYSMQYSDQSHYIREFRDFAGITPGEYLKMETDSLGDFTM